MWGIYLIGFLFLAISAGAHVYYKKNDINARNGEMIALTQFLLWFAFIIGLFMGKSG